LFGAALTALSAPAMADPEPAQGRFLVATPELQDPNFVAAVILIVAHDQAGTLGLVLNRPTQVHPRELFPDVDGAEGYQGRIFYGGPVAVFGALALIRSARAPAEAEPVMPDVWISGGRRGLEITPRDEAHVRLYVGHAGWGPGQLDWEISRGSWRVVAGSADVVFATRPDEMWPKILPPRRELVRQETPTNTETAGSTRTATQAARATFPHRESAPRRVRAALRHAGLRA
jgi:putative transcriptional regulator